MSKGIPIFRTNFIIRRIISDMENEKRKRGRPRKTQPEFPGLPRDLKAAAEEVANTHYEGKQVQLNDVHVTVKPSRKKADKPFFTMSQEYAQRASMNPNLNIYARVFFFLLSKMDYGNWVRRITLKVIAKDLCVSLKSVKLSVQALVDDNMLLVTRNGWNNEYKVKPGDYVFNPENIFKGPMEDKSKVKRLYTQTKMELS